MSDGSNLIVKRIGTYDLTGNRLGKGNFAFVELAINRITKSKVAVKVIDTRQIKDEYVKRNILREAFILKKIQHPNVVKLYETLKQRGVYCLVTEYVAGGELLGFIRSQPESRLSEAQAKPIVRQIASALHHLHERGIIHRDLKMENILLDEVKKNIKIVDFGLSNVCKPGDYLKTQCGSPEYAAPELFKKDCKYGSEVDLWSLGVITFGMLVGKLPFRTMHSGIRGRNDLVDQMSRGLNTLHGKYLSFLTPECQDFLRRLLEPNSYIRLQLEEVMIHSWITTKGSWPLVPYSPPVIDEETTDKIYNQVSELLKMPKSKLKIHMSRNRYDSISGIYHLMLDEYLHRETESDKAINKDRRDRHILWNPKTNQERESRDRKSISHRSPDGVIKVCIKQTIVPSHEQGEGENENEEIKKEEKETKEKIILKPVSGNDLLDRAGGIDSLRIRGMRLSPSSSRDKRQNRPYTTDLTSNHRYRSNSVTPPPRPQSMKAQISREESAKKESHAKNLYLARPHSIDIKFEEDDSKNEPHKKKTEKMTATSPRKEKEVGKVKETITKTKDAGDNIIVEEAKTEEVSVGASEEKYVDKFEKTYLRCTAEDVQDANSGGIPKKEPSHPGISSVTVIARNTELQRRPLKSPRHLRCGPKNKPYFVNSPDITSTHISATSKDQAPQQEKMDTYAKTEYRNKTPDNMRKLRGKSARSRGQSEKDLIAQIQKLDEGEGKIANSLNAIYQGYVSKCKPHHRKLSIMQAHEILQRESKFQSKYGRRPESSKQDNETITEEKTDEKNSSEEGTPITKAKIVRREKKPQNYFKASGTSGLTLKEDHRDLYLHASQCRWMKNEILESGLLNKEREKPNKNPEENKRTTSPKSEAKDDKVVAQEESLKRQKQKELKEEVEREKKRIERELHDSERVKMIEQYLDDVYTRYSGINTTTLQIDKKGVEKERPHSKIQKRGQGQIYSWIPRKKTQRSFSPGGPKKTPSILHNSNQPSQNFSIGHLSKKVDFKEIQAGETHNNKVRYFNDWSKAAFINYVNSEGEFKIDEANQDLTNKLKDGGYWLKRHLSGVVMKANTKNAGTGPASKP